MGGRIKLYKRVGGSVGEEGKCIQKVVWEGT